MDVFPPAPIPLFPHSLDSDQKDQLIEVIEKLLADKTTVSRTPCLPSPKMWGCQCPHQASHPSRGCHHPHQTSIPVEMPPPQ